MQNYYLVDYIRENSNIDRDIFDSIRYELDHHIYFYGKQFKTSKENNFSLQTLFKAKKLELSKILFILYKILLSEKALKGGINILSNSYFSTNVELGKLGFNVYRPPWNIGREIKALVDLKTHKEIEFIKKSFSEKRFIDIINPEFIDRVHSLKSTLKNYFLDYKISALFVPYDMGFFENLSIKVFSEINKPSFIFLHGLPGRYNKIDDNRSDYLIVWGGKIKENYIKGGINEEKIFVAGHPYYKKYTNKYLKFDFADPLIITKAQRGAQHSDTVILSDRGNLILYLYLIESTLKKIGVKRARFRPHPSESSQWYLKFIDNEFYEVDNKDLRRSLQESTIVIGPTSTVFLESLYEGVNYIGFEPSMNNVDLGNASLVPPFDGSDERLPVAKNEEELERIIKDKLKVDARIFNDYVKTPFDLSFVKTMI